MKTTNVTSLSGLKKLESFYNLKQKEILCPVNKMRVLATPLTVGDDLSLRTMITSPDVYDKELSSLIFRHVKILDTDKKYQFNDFIENFSIYDRRVMLYGIYSTTYNKISENEITCNNCKESFKDVIKSDEIIDADFCKVWDKDQSFKDYTKDIEIEINNNDNSLNKIIFVTRIPSIKEGFNVLKLVNPIKIRENFQKTGQILSKSEDLSLVTKFIKIESTSNGKKLVDIVDDIKDINTAISDFITPDIIDIVLSSYNQEFSKYNPSFKKHYICQNCGFLFDVPVNIEESLFRNFFGF